MLKTCSRCGEKKHPYEFRSRTGSVRKTGRHSACKVCESEYQKAWRRSEAGQAAMRLEAVSPARLARLEKLTDSPKTLVRKAAYDAVRYAVRVSKLPRVSSLECELDSPTCHGKLQYHHDSYLEADRLHVRCLCRAHHSAWHRENEAIYPETPIPISTPPL